MRAIIKHLRAPALGIVGFFSVVTVAWSQATPAADAGAASTWVRPDPWFVYGIILLVLVGSLIAMLMIRSAIVTSGRWSIADALAEETEVTAMKPDANGRPTAVPQLDAAGKPLTITDMRASISRLIALMGMMAILMIFLGFGAFALYGFAMTGTIPDMSGVINFLMAGLTLFAPYLVNKFSSIFEAFAPKR